MKRPFVFTFILLCASFAFAQAQTETAPPAEPAIGPSAIWWPGTRVLSSMGRSCRDQASETNFDDCFLDQMRINGAPADAIFVTRLLTNNGILAGYRDTGRIDVAWVFYPFRANENNSLLLVNGDPRIVDVDDQSLWPMEKLARDPVYAALAKKYPKISVFPGPRGLSEFPRITKLSIGGQNFMIGYYLQDGCHACARIGTASFGFHFDTMGKFAGVYIEEVEANNGRSASD